ncbi:hypothetical protein BDW59DRAFT_147393 [Aspergillus cavernicola]|uniref:Mid2 domain-containing protein n=1 Tax=Aspergillus cavernicola TaxID=176166 RepID=A0ABR4I9P7_9EURO
MADCWSLHSGRLSVNHNDAPCADVNTLRHNTTCCVKGTTCLSNGICLNADGKGWYSADCTDSTLESPWCQIRCAGFYGSQLTYDESSQLWSCCSYNDNKQANCTAPTDETFMAPAPSDLSTIIYLPTSGTIPYSTPTATTASTAASIPTDSDSSPSPSTSPGLAAGIGIGVGVGVVAIATIGLFLFSRRRDRSTSTKQISDTDYRIAQQPLQHFELEQNSSVTHEAEAGHAYAELEGHNKP